MAFPPATPRAKGRDPRLLPCLVIAVNAIVLANALLHSPSIGYDAPEHLANARALAHLHLPTPAESAEYFSPPLPYLVPALAFAAGAGDRLAYKAGQLANVALSLLLTFALLRFCDEAFPGRGRVKLLALGLLGTLPVFYKGLSQVRGEPYLAALAVVAGWLAVRAFLDGEPRFRDGALLGVALGLALLARQWGALLVPALVVVACVAAWRRAASRGRILGSLAVALSVALLVGGWYYAVLAQRYGSLTPFNRPVHPPPGWPRAAQVSGAWAKAFTDPVRPTLGDRWLPIFYSDVWGDYHAYFSIYALDRRTGAFLPGYALEAATAHGRKPAWLETNRFTFARYLGWVNRVSVLPSLLLLAGILYGTARLPSAARSAEKSDLAAGLAALVVWATAVGYILFLRTFPSSGNGDTVKAVYVLQAYPFLAVLGALLLDRVRSRRLLVVLGALLAAVALFDLPAMVTHVVALPG